TRADAAGIDEPAAVIITDHQGTDGLRQRGRERIASHYEFLGVGAFRLDEGLRAAAAVGRIRAFGDDALKAHLAGMAQHQRARLLEMLAVPDGPLCFLPDQTLQLLL